MILQLLLTAFFGLLDFLVSLIPKIDFGLSFGLLEPLGYVFSFIDLFISIKVVLAIFAFNLIRDNFTLLKNIFFAVIRKIPTIG